MLIILNKFSLSEHNCHLLSVKYINRGFPGGTSGKEPTCQSIPASARDSHLIPGLGRFLGKEWQPTPLSCLDNSMDRGAHWATVHEVSTPEHTPSHTNCNCTAQRSLTYMCICETATQIKIRNVSKINTLMQRELLF